MQTHTGSAFVNRATLTFDRRVNAYQATAVHRSSTKFSVDSSNTVSFYSADTHTHTHTHTHTVTDATGHPTHRSATVSVGN